MAKRLGRIGRKDETGYLLHGDEALRVLYIRGDFLTMTPEQMAAASDSLLIRAPLGKEESVEGTLVRLGITIDNI